MRRTVLPLLCAALATPAAAQVTLTPRALAVGGAYIATARGQEALFQNPANLGLSGTPYWSLAFPQLSVGSSLAGVQFGDIPDLIEYESLPQDRIGEILDGIPESGLEVGLDVRIPLVAIQVKRVAVGVSYGSVHEQTLARGLADLVLNGYDPGRTDYSLGATRGSRYDYVDIAAAVGRKIGPLSVGVTGHYLHGRTLARTRLFEPRFDLETQDFEAEYREVKSEGGSGFAVDVGVAAEPVRHLVVSAAVSNAVAQMSWNETLRTRHLIFDRARIESDPMTIFSGFTASQTDVDPASAPFTVYETAEGIFEESYFPATLRAGAEYFIPTTRTRLSASYQDVLTSGRLGLGWLRQAGAGVEQKLPLVTVRAGVATDLEGAKLLSGGVSLGPLTISAARTEQSLDGGYERVGWIGTFGLSMRTTGSLP